MWFSWFVDRQRGKTAIKSRLERHRRSDKHLRDTAQSRVLSGKRREIAQTMKGEQKCKLVTFVGSVPLAVPI